MDVGEASLQYSEETSLFALGTTLLRERWRIVRWLAAGGVIAAMSTISTPRVFQATASFVPDGSNTNSRLANLAGQFGVSLGGTNPSVSPAFYESLLHSHSLLSTIARDSFLVQDSSNARIAFIDLFRIKGDSPAIRQELAIRNLADLVKPSVDVKTGIVSVSITTRWPTISYQIISSLIAAVNDYDRRTRQSQAAAESRFLRERVETESIGLRAAEDRLEQFLSRNRELVNSPQLRFENDRLQREVTLQQQVFTSLTQAYEDAQIRAVRNTPVITMVESPFIPAMAQPRGRLKRVVLGLILGGFLGVLVVFASKVMARARASGGEDVKLFFDTLDEAGRAILRPFSRRQS